MKFQKNVSLFTICALLIALAGCATGRNYSTDIDALNARISALEGQLSEKNAELLRLQTEMGSGQSNVDALRSEKDELQRRLDAALSQLESKSYKTQVAPAPKAEESDLK